ncbi:MAG: electron transfer flavoprotein subunit alpha [Spirochaetales bacterium]|nr:electron transfer flavoprotein subunit alpha [Spirochaetales bacterium]
MSGIQVIVHKCVGCGVCEQVCPYGAITMENDLPLFGPECTLCGACVEACPYDAIIIVKETSEEVDPSGYSGILVYAEHRSGRIASVVPEIIGAALALKKDLGEPVAALLMGKDVSAAAAELLQYGIDTVYLADHPDIRDFEEDTAAEVFAQVVRMKKPAIVLGGGTVEGRSLLPRVAVKLRTGLTADCTELAIEPESRLLKQTRPAFGGNIMATILTERNRPQMATVRHKVMSEAPRLEGPVTGTVEKLKVTVPPSALEVLEFVEERSDTVNLTEADVIVSAGRGIKDPKNLVLVEKLALAAGGALGASRAVVDAGWIPYSHQVGQTGKTVNPTVYIACGISGAIQHLAGMKSSDIIVAVNSDEHAPIFEVADYGIVGDLFEVIPEMIKQLGG